MPANREPRCIGEGAYGSVIYDPQNPGKVTKYVHSFDTFDQYAPIEEHTYDLLMACGINTIPEFTLHYGGAFSSMTDLSNGARNLVLSLIDALSMKPEEKKLFYSTTRNHPIWNGEEFFAQLDDIFEKAVRNNIRFNHAALFLIAKGGQLETCIGDFQDAIQIDSLEMPFGQKDYEEMQWLINSYLCKAVTCFFPQLTSQAQDFTNYMQKKYTKGSPNLAEPGGD